MTGTDEFLALLRDGLGLPVEPEHLDVSLDQVPGWDSLHLLWLSTALESLSGHQVPLPAVLQAKSLAGIYELYA